MHYSTSDLRVCVCVSVTLAWTVCASIRTYAYGTPYAMQTFANYKPRNNLEPLPTKLFGHLQVNSPRELSSHIHMLLPLLVGAQFALPAVPTTGNLHE